MKKLLFSVAGIPEKRSEILRKCNQRDERIAAVTANKDPSRSAIFFWGDLAAEAMGIDKQRRQGKFLDAMNYVIEVSKRYYQYAAPEEILGSYVFTVTSLTVW